MIQKKIGFIGAGNMTRSLIKGLLSSGEAQPDQIFVTGRTMAKPNELVQEYGVKSFTNNDEMVEVVDVVVIAVKPQDFYHAIEPLAAQFDSSQIVVSLAAGISLEMIHKILPNIISLARVMPNTAIGIQEGILGYCLLRENPGLKSFIENFLMPLGMVVEAEEGDSFEALTVACSSGIAFVYELMQYWQEWLEEHGFESAVAKKLTIKTFSGAALLADKNSNTSILNLQRKVVSKKGVTAAGLDSMGELEVERLLRYSFEKAVLRDREIGQRFKSSN